MIESKNTYKNNEQILLVEEPSKNKYGQYFTPEIVADFMINLASINENSKILEPSCGEGVFLDLLAKKGYDNFSAYELDRELIPNKYKDVIKNESFVSARINEKYDLIIGNPPYIRWKNLEEELNFENDLFQADWEEVGYYYKDFKNPSLGKAKVGYPFASNTSRL